MLDLLSRHKAEVIALLRTVAYDMLSRSERKPREERWSELIEVATDVFYAKGYDAASLQDIADRLGQHVANAVAERSDVPMRPRKSLRTAFPGAPTEHAE